jgi:hypothetical protein
MEEKRNAYRILVENPEGKRPLGIPLHRWEDKVKMDHRKIAWCDMNCIHLVEDRDQW